MSASIDLVHICLASLLILYLYVQSSSADDFIFPEREQDSYRDILFKPEKRYAMISSGYGNSRGRSRYKYDYNYGKRYFGHSNNPYKHYSRYYSRNPWNNLPNKQCFRQECYSSKDCCKYHNICDASAKRCIDCWRGYSCTSSKDCCARYPRCDSRRKGCTR